jgi:hypothetical protein
MPDPAQKPDPGLWPSHPQTARPLLERQRYRMCEGLRMVVSGHADPIQRKSCGVGADRLGPFSEGLGLGALTYEQTIDYKLDP